MAARISRSVIRPRKNLKGRNARSTRNSAQLEPTLNELKAIKELLQKQAIQSEKSLRNEEVLFFSEAAEFLEVSKSTLYKFIHRNVIPHCKPTPGVVTFERKELLLFLKRNPSKTQEEIAEIANLYLSKNKLKVTRNG